MANEREIQEIRDRLTRLENQFQEKPRTSLTIKILIGLILSVVVITLILTSIGILQFISG
ncbi:hypothetical protein [Paenibacillus sp. GCM10028914]|uniref:hypothetical protein n=1 Tax=Paenibacillus sp. GCM10028914 TaxID=3273416 RepID=UPI0036088C37